ncbi:high-temperature-induced dauer-formation protein-domain-containing protein [Choanephora cucurbitarum]|nr:high-temperature-induced dauer-formation protein-domain-containing protein [Choanephora cucurbitarum]
MGATDSKLAFRKGVFRLFEEKHIPTSADDYWTLFWTLPESVDDVYTLVSSTDIRKARDHAIENLETLIDKIMEHMDRLLQTTAPIPSIQLLNCCRVLTRIMPYIFESPECAEWEHKFFWTPDASKTNPLPRGEHLLSLTLQSLFLAGFTLPHTMSTAQSRVNFVIWETGVGSSTPIGSSRDNDLNRTEVLRLLTVLLSKSIYVTPAHLTTQEDRWLHYMVSKTERKVVLAFLCSMINTACKFNPMGWTAVPYNHIVFSDPREHLVTLCLRGLLIVLDYRPTIENEEHQQHEDEGKTQESVSENAFRYYLSKLHRAQDFQFSIDGIYRILSSPMQTLNSYLPGSSKRVRCHVEMMMLCWKLLEVNNRFRKYLIETERALDLMIVLLYYASENKLDPSQVGLVRMCSFILQTLSSDRTFSVKLNKPFDGHGALPVNIKIPNFHGTYADYLILTIFSLIASSRGALSTLYPAMIKTITNISPYLKHLSSTTSNKLVALFGSMSAPGFLLADEPNHLLAGYLLEAFNHIIQFQFSNNPHFIYAVLRSHRKFEKLAEFNLENGLIEIERQLKRQQEDNLQEGHHDLSEKAKGKLPESLSGGSSGINTPQRQPSVSSIGSMALPGAKNGFIPTDEWIQQWHSKLPLEIIMTLIHELKSQLESQQSHEQLLEFLTNVSTDKLPPAHPVVIRKFQWSEPSVIWFRSMLWGQAYVASVSSYGPWNNTQVKLFHIKQPQPSSSSIETS